MKNELIKADVMLLFAALIWGIAFVAQRVGMAHIGPFTFNGIRFILGILSLMPIIYYNTRKRNSLSVNAEKPLTPKLIGWGIVVGVCLFAGASLQQIGLVYTTAGKAGFITGLYVVFVPILGLFLGHRPDVGTWIGTVLAAIGLYMLSVTDSLTIALGDLLVLISSFFWSCHVLMIAWLTRRFSPLHITLVQFLTCAALSLLTAVFLEPFTIEGIQQATIPLLYGGFISVGIAYTLQVIGQKYSPPAHAAILLSLESFFAAVSGWIILGETLSLRAILGCTLMMAAMLASQMQLLLAPTSRQ
jgi:drug/metabolite transporter (DMT)-like permease